MQKRRLLNIILLLSFIISLFFGCQPQNADAPTEPTGTNVSSQPTHSTESINDLTEPTPTEPVYSCTVESFKTHLKPYMTYGEVKALWGPKSTDASDSLDWQEAIWFLEDDYFVYLWFYPTVAETWWEYMPIEPTSPENQKHSLAYWRNHMEVYTAWLCKGDIDGKREVVKVWFDYGYGPFWQEEETP